MSASNKKKLRKEQMQSKLTEKQQAERKEAKKLQTTTIIFTTVIVLVLAIGIGMIGYNWYTNSGLRERWTTAVEIGDHKLSVAELNYYYIDVLYELQNDWYSMYLLQLEEGFDSTVALDEQLYHGEEGKTWGDYFIDLAIEEASGVLALCDAAEKEGYTLSKEEKAEIDDTILAMETEGKLYGYTNLDDYLQAVYGKGAQESTYRAYVENITLAQSYYNNYVEGLEYTDAEMQAYEDENGSYSSFTYTSMLISPEDFLEHGEDSTEHNHTDAETAAALNTAKETAEALAASGATNKEELDAAAAGLDVYKTHVITEETTGETENTTEETTGETEETTEETTGETEETTEETTSETTEETTGETTEETTEETTVESNAPTATESTDAPYSQINTSIRAWLIEDGRQAGDIAAIPYYTLDEDGNPTDTIESYYVVIYGSENTHETDMVNVRHILIAYEGGTTDETTGETVYSDTEKQAARDEIAKIQAEWENGEKTEESFAELAKTHSDDNAEDGGLYEDVYPGWAVDEFDAWCFQSDRKAGDYGVVETEFGVHLIYFVEEQDVTYREYMITTDMHAADSEEWYTAMRDSYKNATVIKKTSLLDTGIVMSG